MLIYDALTRKLRGQLTRFKDKAYSGSFRADGKLLVAGSETGHVQVSSLLPFSDTTVSVAVQPAVPQQTHSPVPVISYQLIAAQHCHHLQRAQPGLASQEAFGRKLKCITTKVHECSHSRRHGSLTYWLYSLTASYTSHSLYASLLPAQNMSSLGAAALCRREVTRHHRTTSPFGLTLQVAACIQRPCLARSLKLTDCMCIAGL